MKHYNYVVLLAATAFVATSFIKPFHKDDWTQLFNGKDLNGWDTYYRPSIG